MRGWGLGELRGWGLGELRGWGMEWVKALLDSEFNYKSSGV